MDNLTRLLHGLVDCLQLNLTYKTCVLRFRSVSGVNMTKLKYDPHIEEQLQVAVEQWEHTVMSEVRDYVAMHGADTFKDALIMFDKDTYNKMFHPVKEIDKCYLTTPK